MADPHRVLFVCSGNICRSPMAEGIAKTYAEQRGLWVEARSAGTLHIYDRMADSQAIKACQRIGIDITRHLSQGITDELVAWADHILVMEYHHLDYIRDNHEGAGDILLLGTFAGTPEIADPIGGWFWQFNSARDQIKTATEAFLDRLPRR